jgi:tetraacyldisaccharide 4'-kinase
VTAGGFAERHWYRKSALSRALWPLSIVFGTIVALRRTLYRCGLFRVTRAPVPVVVVGNLVAGGTGKTPLVLWLVGQLAARGYRPGIVARGYGGRERGPAEVTPHADWRAYGDEPVLLAERSGCPVWIGHDRAVAVLALLGARPECDVIVCDDGLQHYALARDAEIAVQDARGSGNGYLLPAGPLREPITRRVDATIVNGGRGVEAMSLEPAGFRRVTAPQEEISLTEIAAKRLHAVAGIGDPQRFFATLAALGLDFTPHAFADHHPFVPADLEFADCEAVLMTEKDAVKCRSFGRDDLYALRVEAHVDPALADLVTRKIDGR